MVFPTLEKYFKGGLFNLFALLIISIIIISRVLCFFKCKIIRMKKLFACGVEGAVGAKNWEYCPKNAISSFVLKR